MRKALMTGLVAGVMATTALGQDTADKVGPTKPLPPVEEQVIEESESLEALKLIQSYMTDVKSLKSSFMQRSEGGKPARGKLYMERPGKIRMQYDDEIPFLTVADGKTLNFVDYEIGQVQKWPVKDTPLKAIIGEGFDLASVNAHIEIAPEGREDLLALTASDPDRPEMGQVTVFFQKAAHLSSGLQLIAWRVLDAQGQTTMIDIYDQEVNVALASNLWTFDDPRGIAKRRRRR